jgi:uncharacterized membrane protein YphA (DoxX/SURF4 family)
MKYFTPVYAPLVLRYVLAFVLLWFAFSQLAAPASWYGVLPAWTSDLFISQHTFVILNALFEVVAAIFLLLGVWVRPFAILLTLHMLSIAMTVGLTGVGARDIGLAGAFLALAMLGRGPYALGE